MLVDLSPTAGSCHISYQNQIIQLHNFQLEKWHNRFRSTRSSGASTVLDLAWNCLAISRLYFAFTCWRPSVFLDCFHLLAFSRQPSVGPFEESWNKSTQMEVYHLAKPGRWHSNGSWENSVNSMKAQDKIWGMERQSSLKGQETAVVNQTSIGTVSKATLGKPLRNKVERIWAFLSFSTEL